MKIAMRKKHIIPTRKVNMYSNRLVLTKLLKYLHVDLPRWDGFFLLALTLSDLQLDFDSFVSFVVLRVVSSSSSSS